MNIDTATIRNLAQALLQSGRRSTSVVSSAYQTLTRQGLLSNAELQALSRVDAVAETMFLMMAADGRLDPEERLAVRGAIRGLTGDVLQDGTIDVMLENYQAQLVREGRPSRLHHVASSLAPNAEDAEGAFALAAAVALADDQVATAELELIDQLAEWFGISPARAASLLDQLEGKRPA
jgi:tellurite resistance protein